MYAIDTLAAVQRLEQAGLEKPAAEAITSLFAEGFTATIRDLATKSDIEAVKTEIKAVESRLTTKIEAVESRLTTKIEAVESRLDTKSEVQTQTLKAHITYIVVVANITTVLLVALLLKLL